MLNHARLSAPACSAESDKEEDSRLSRTRLSSEHQLTYLIEIKRGASQALTVPHDVTQALAQEHDYTPGPDQVLFPALLTYCILI